MSMTPGKVYMDAQNFTSCLQKFRKCTKKCDEIYFCYCTLKDTYLKVDLKVHGVCNLYILLFVKQCALSYNANRVFRFQAKESNTFLKTLIFESEFK